MKKKKTITEPYYISQFVFEVFKDKYATLIDLINLGIDRDMKEILSKNHKDYIKKYKLRIRFIPEIITEEREKVVSPSPTHVTK